MTAQEALKAALRDVLAPLMRNHGYKGSAPTWRKFSEKKDCAVVNVQSSSFSSSEHVQCVVNLSFAPEPWLRWMSEHLGAGMPKAVNESLGLYRERLHPDGTAQGTDGWWGVSDDTSARSAVEDMTKQLDRAGWPVLEGLFSRETLMSRLDAGDLGMMRRSNSEVFFARAEALMLMAAGPSDALESRLAIALKNVTPAQREHAERFDTWVRGQAAMV